MNNSIEEALTEVKHDENEIDLNLAMMSNIMDAISKKTEIVEKFISPDDLKTQLSAAERTLIPLLDMLGRNPFPEMTARNPKLKKEFASVELKLFLAGYIRLGIATDRKGRKEDLEAVQSLSGEEMQLLMRGNKNQGGGMLG